MTTAYADYTYYTGTFLGNKIPVADFPRLALRASAVVDRVTFNRAASQTDVAVVDAIKMATCAIAEEQYKTEQEGIDGGITSETVGRHSVSYSESSEKRASNFDRYIAAAETYLVSTGLMFRGFTEDEQ